MSFERRKNKVGRVISDTMDKTVVVEVEWRSLHPVYRKSVKRRTRFNAHDEQNACQLGDTVRIVESRPISKTKRWKVAEIISHQEIAEIQPGDISAESGVVLAGAGSTSVETGTEDASALADA